MKASAIVRTYCDPRLEELDLTLAGLSEAEQIKATQAAAVERERRLYFEYGGNEGFTGYDD